MLNILSVEPGHKVTGKQINDWCAEQIATNGSHFDEALKFIDKNYQDETIYEAIRTELHSGHNAPKVLTFRKVI